MKNFYTLIFLLLIFLPNYSNGQHGTLVEDFYEGPQGSVKTDAVVIGGDIYYIGSQSDTSDHMVLKYNVIAQEISLVTPTNNQSINKVAIYATENNIYVTSLHDLYQYSPSTGIVKLASDTENGAFIRNVYVNDGVIVYTAYVPFAGSWVAYYYNENTEVAKKILTNETTLEDEFRVTIGNDYITINSGIDNGQPKDSQIFDKNNGGRLAIKDIIPDYSCGVQYNLQTVGSYIFFNCGYEDYLVNVSTMEVQYLGFIDNERLNENETHIFAQSNFRITSIDKTDYDIQILHENFQRPMLFFEDEFYILDYVDDVLIRFSGNAEDTKSFDVNLELNSLADIIDVIRVDDKVLVAIYQHQIGSYIFELNDDGLIPILEELPSKVADELIFLNSQEKLLFTYDNEMYGEELFLLDLESNSVETINDFPFNVYPNPASTYITLDKNKDQFKASLINSLGMTCTNLNTGVNDVSMLSSGVYYLKIVDVDNNMNYFKPIIISK